MPNSPSGPVRRAQLIAPFGVGAMVTVPGGTSLMVAGLDYWYKNHDGSEISDVEEFKFEEWRLQSLLGVGHLRLPPDYRDSSLTGNETLNLEITIPAFRFPAWHFCPECKLLEQRTLFERGIGGRIKCPECNSKRKTRYMFQVPFIAMCEFGHLQDFPWREWVHKDSNPSCKGKIRLYATGSATLAGQKIKCDDCHAERTLEGITQASTKDGSTSTTLSRTLSPNKEFLCDGSRPWLGPDANVSCNAHIKGSLRSASNVYFGKMRSSIYLPRVEDNGLQELEIILGTTPLSTLITLLSGLGMGISNISDTVKSQQSRLLAEYTKDQINSVLKVILNPQTTPGNSQKIGRENIPLDEDEHTEFRRTEYDGLKKERNDVLLKVRVGDLDKYSSIISNHFSRIMLVEQLQETRTLTGFTRVFPENNLTNLQRQEMLWKTPPANSKSSWLPAYKVFGEGIFFEFDEEKLSRWESREAIKKKVQPLLDKYRELQINRHLQDRIISPRFILIHTFAHLVMNRLTFDCGYGSAALRERLYISSNAQAPMAGVLIYTADGDSEGTMGGLVRMGKPGQIEPVIIKALESAKWCSADPVCMEMGNTHGQGPDSCNLAACHNCALVPETACEEFNRFLDRGVVVGSLEDPAIGYFSL